MHCFSQQSMLQFLLLALLSIASSFGQYYVQLDSEDLNYGYIEHVEPDEYDNDELNNQPDLGEGFIIQNLVEDQPTKDIETFVERSRRDVNETSIKDSEQEDDEGSGEEIEEITLHPPHHVPKADKPSKPPLYISPEDTTGKTGDLEPQNTVEAEVSENTTEVFETKSISTTVKSLVTIEDDDSKTAKLHSASSTQWVAPLIAAITSGIVFFFVGFFLDKCRRNRQEATQNSGFNPMTTKNGKDGFSHPEGVELQSIRTEGSTENKLNRIYETTTNKAGRTESLDEEKIPLTEAPAQFSTFKATNKRQSPVDIKLAMVKYEEKLMKSVLTIKKEKKKFIVTNTGTTLKVEPDGDSAVVAGGPLGKKQYLLDHFHFHWGSVDSRGSEHLLNGKAFAAEMHLVFSDTDIVSFDVALKSDRGDSLAVLAVFIELGTEHSKMKSITDVMGDVEYKEESAEVEEFDVTSILPANLSEYWTYSGSLTTPPYSENVLWIVFRQPVQLSHHQMAAFRKLTSVQKMAGAAGEGAADNRPVIADNFRKAQPLGERPVFASFR